MADGRHVRFEHSASNRCGFVDSSIPDQCAFEPAFPELRAARRASQPAQHPSAIGKRQRQAFRRYAALRAGTDRLVFSPLNDSIFGWLGDQIGARWPMSLAYYASHL